MHKPLSEYWRVRVKAGYTDEDDRTREAWDRDEVGVWYGASTAQDIMDALAQNNVGPAIYVRNLTANQEIARRYAAFSRVNFYSPSIRFAKIPINDWVVVFLKETQQIGVAQICGEIQSEKSHPLNLQEQIFKFRKLCNKKTFRLSHLPAAYHLLSSAGWGNVHRFNGMRQHVHLLVQSRTEEDVSCAFHKMESEGFLDFLGAAEWESFCTAYLIIEEGFVPTGLSTGRALPVVDIVGRRCGNRSRIYAQCKKAPDPRQIGDQFRALCRTLDADDTAYFFAYGGCHGNHENMTVFDKGCALKWAATENGKQYIELFRRGVTAA